LIAVFVCSLVSQSPGQKRATKTSKSSKPSQAASDTSTESRIAALLQSGKLEEAEELARGSVRNNPRDGQAHALLGVILDQRGRHDEAEKELREAVRLSPNSAGALTNLAVLLVRTKRPDEAVIAFKRVLRIRAGELQSRVAVYQS
jgi:Flp pilus assembly protein TadD